MNSLPYSYALDQTSSYFSSPYSIPYSAFDYASLLSNISNHFHNSAIHLIKSILENLDAQFRNLPERTNRYYVKQTRNRTIITPFGELTYLRTEYIDRHTSLPFCPVDRAIGLLSRQRFDPAVQAMIYEEYANSNSMIKVGQRIGDRIFHHFSIDPNRKLHTISRQTVFNILKRFDSIDVQIPPIDTPGTLYIMADEKYIPLQKSPPNHPSSFMAKAAVIFEGIDFHPKRNQLRNKHYICAAKGQNLWELVLDHISQRYDLSSVNQIFILGDGASWITSGQSYLRGLGPQVTFALDRFHFGQAINRFTTDTDCRALLRQYALQAMKDDFLTLLDSLFDQITDPSDSVIQAYHYLKNHYNQYQTMISLVKIGCPMEQVISHVFASNFTSVPKAYSIKNLPRYINARIHHVNQLDLRHLWLQAVDIQLKHPDRSDILIQPDFFDSSIFDDLVPPDTYSLPFSDFNRTMITKF